MNANNRAPRAKRSNRNAGRQRSEAKPSKAIPKRLHPVEKRVAELAGMLTNAPTPAAMVAALDDSIERDGRLVLEEEDLELAPHVCSLLAARRFISERSHPSTAIHDNQDPTEWHPLAPPYPGPPLSARYRAAIEHDLEWLAKASKVSLTTLLDVLRFVRLWVGPTCSGKAERCANFPREYLEVGHEMNMARAMESRPARRKAKNGGA
jgi:hypothetical protein